MVRQETSGFPLNAEGEIDKEQARKLYDASVHVAWTPFVQEMGWDLVRSRSVFPSVQWVKEKRFRLARDQAESLQAQLDQARPRINADLVRTLEEYPQAHDKLLRVVNAATIALNNEMADFMKKTMESQARGQGSPQVRKGLIGEVMALSMALDRLTTSKYKALLISDQTVKAVVEKAELDQQVETGKEADQVNPLRFEVMGWEQITPDRLDHFYRQYFDPPQPKIADPEAIQDAQLVEEQDG